MLCTTTEGLSKDGWLAAAWKQEWERTGPTHIHHYILDPGDGTRGDDLPRQQWTLLNRLRTGVGRFKSSMKKWGLADSAACQCGASEQTVEHIMTTCPLYRPPSEARLFDLGPEMLAWLHATELDL